MAGSTLEQPRYCTCSSYDFTFRFLLGSNASYSDFPYIDFNKVIPNNDSSSKIELFLGYSLEDRSFFTYYPVEVEDAEDDQEDPDVTIFEVERSEEQREEEEKEREEEKEMC